MGKILQPQAEINFHIAYNASFHRKSLTPKAIHAQVYYSFKKVWVVMKRRPRLPNWKRSLSNTFRYSASIDFVPSSVILRRWHNVQFES